MPSPKLGIMRTEHLISLGIGKEDMPALAKLAKREKMAHEPLAEAAKRVAPIIIAERDGVRAKPAAARSTFEMSRREDGLFDITATGISATKAAEIMSVLG